MDRFKTYFDKNLYFPDDAILTEKLITFGGKAYPKFNNVLILAGGGGSGKGFSLSNLIGIEGKHFDVDALKSLALKAPKLIKKIEKQFGKNIAGLDLRKPDNVSLLHNIIGDELKLDDKQQDVLFKNILTANPKMRPNIIFDVTLKDVRKLEKLSFAMTQLGYKKENIHIVWILNSIEVALAQNLAPDRGRVVPEDILIQTHEGASLTMKRLLSNAALLSKYMNGDFWISANMRGVDVTMAKSKMGGPRFDPSPIDKKGKQIGQTSGSVTKGGAYITDANYWQIKKKGKAPMAIKDFEDLLMKKLKKYTPKIDSW